jgi:hypothetical protein
MKFLAGAVVVALVAAAWFAWPRAEGGGGGNDVTVLDPLSESAMPGVQDAIRVQAEANLHLVISTMSMQFAQSGSVATITPQELAQFEPSMTFVNGETPSDDPNVASIGSAADAVTAAIAAPGGICAYARFDENAQVSTVTTSGGECTAASAPTHGWTVTNGGSGGGGGVPFGIDPGQLTPTEPDLGLQAN